MMVDERANIRGFVFGVSRSHAVNMADLLQAEYLYINLAEDPIVLPTHLFNLTNDPPGWPTFESFEAREQHIAQYLQDLLQRHFHPADDNEAGQQGGPGIQGQPGTQPSCQLPSPHQQQHASPASNTPPHSSSPLSDEEITELVQISPLHMVVQQIDEDLVQRFRPNFVLTSILNRLPEHGYQAIIDRFATQDLGNIDELLDLIEQGFPLLDHENEQRGLPQTLAEIPSVVLLNAIMSRFDSSWRGMLLEKVANLFYVDGQIQLAVEEILRQYQNRAQVTAPGGGHPSPPHSPPPPNEEEIKELVETQVTKPRGGTPGEGHPPPLLTDVEIDKMIDDFPLDELVEMLNLSLQQSLPGHAVLINIFDKLPESDFQEVVDTLTRQNPAASVGTVLNMIEQRFPLRTDLSERRELPAVLQNIPTNDVLLGIVMRFHPSDHRTLMTELLRALRVSAQTVIDEILTRFQNISRIRSPGGAGSPDLTKPPTPQLRQLLLSEATSPQGPVAEGRKSNPKAPQYYTPYIPPPTSPHTPAAHGGRGSKPRAPQYYTPYIPPSTSPHAPAAHGRGSNPRAPQYYNPYPPPPISPQAPAHSGRSTPAAAHLSEQRWQDQRAEEGGSPYSPRALTAQLSEERRKHREAEEGGSPYSPRAQAAQLSEQRRKHREAEESGSPYCPAAQAPQLSDQRWQHGQAEQDGSPYFPGSHYFPSFLSLEEQGEGISFQLDEEQVLAQRELNFFNELEQGYKRYMNTANVNFSESLELGNMDVQYAQQQYQDQYFMDHETKFGNSPQSHGEESEIDVMDWIVEPSEEEQAREQFNDQNVQSEPRRLESSGGRASSLRHGRGRVSNTYSPIADRTLSFNLKGPRSPSPPYNVGICKVGEVNDNFVPFRGDILITHPIAALGGTGTCLRVWDGLNPDLLKTQLQHGDIMLRIGMYVENGAVHWQADPTTVASELMPYRPYYRLDMYSVRSGPESLRYKFLGYQHPLRYDELAGSFNMDCPGENLNSGDCCPPTFRPGFGDVIIREEAWQENFAHMENFRRSMVKWYKTRYYESDSEGVVQQSTDIPVGTFLVRPFVKRVVPPLGGQMDYSRWGFAELYMYEERGWTFWGRDQLIVDHPDGNLPPPSRQMDDSLLPLLYTLDPGPPETSPHYPRFPYLIFNYQ